MLINNLDMNRKDKFKHIFNELKSAEIYNIVFV